MPWRGVSARVSATGLIALGVTGALASDRVLKPPQAARAQALGGVTPRPAGSGCDGPVRSGDTTIRVRDAAGLVRTARLHVPRAALGHPAPLLLAFHGARASGRFMEGYSGLTAPLDAAGAIGVFPDAMNGRWQLVADASGGDDLAFVRALLGAVERKSCVDARRVLAAGVSNGGGFAALLACEMSGQIAAVAVVAGGFSSLGACRPLRPVSVLEIHGSDDPVVPYGGRPQDGRRGAVRRWLGGWVRRDRCREGPRTTMLTEDARWLTWVGCAGGAEVSHIRIGGGRHQWPGATPPDPGPRIGFSAARVIWEFLADRRLPG